MKRKHVWTALKIFVLVTFLYTWADFVMNGTEVLTRFLSDAVTFIMSIAIWELIRWASADEWRKCGVKGCAFKIRINDPEIGDDVMRKHIMDHGLDAMNRYRR